MKTHWSIRRVYWLRIKHNCSHKLKNVDIGKVPLQDLMMQSWKVSLLLWHWQKPSKSERENGSSRVCWGVWGLRSVLYFLPWKQGSGAKEKRNKGILEASSCTDLRRHPIYSHKTMMSLGRRRTMGTHHQGFRVRKAQMRKHAETPTRGRDNVHHVMEAWAFQLYDVLLFLSLRKYYRRACRLLRDSKFTTKPVKSKNYNW